MKRAVWVFAVIASVVRSLTGSESVGWRGDGSGIYPKADPPIQWHSLSKAVQALRFQIEPPKGDEASGTPMPDGVIREWLVLGPVAAQKGEKDTLSDVLLVENQDLLRPAMGGEAAGSKWQAVKSETAYLDFAGQFDSYGKSVDKSGYAHAYIFSPTGGDFILRVMHTDALHVWLNGQCTHKFAETQQNYTPQKVRFVKGWNRLLLRSTPQRGAKNARPNTGTWYVNLVVEAAPGSVEFTQKNIVFSTALPAPDGFGSPIVTGGKIFLLSEPADLVCLDGATGRILWVRSNNYNDVASDAERKAQPDLFTQIDLLAARLKEVNDSFASASPPRIAPLEGREGFKEKAELEKKLYELMKTVDVKKYAKPAGQDVGYSGFTPLSDGQRVWAWFATGISCCYDLDGKLIWRRLDNEGSFFEHGYSTSPVMADGKIVVFMNKMIAFDALKGDRLWTTEFNRQQFWANRFHGTPAVAKLGAESVCVLPTAMVLRLSDGKILCDKVPGVTAHQQEIPSPVIAGGTVYRLSTWSEFQKFALPIEPADPLKIVAARQLKLDCSRYPTNYLEWHMASPLIHDGLAYLVNNTGVLSVVDVENMVLVYEKLLDLDHFQTAHEGAGRGIAVSPALAGGRIYLIGNSGVTLVLKPGRKYEQLARNRIESVVARYYGLRHERFVACPAFDGKRMYIRGERKLYCVSGE